MKKWNVEQISRCVKKVGRTFETEDTLWMALSGTGVSFEFSGTELEILFKGGVLATDVNNEGSFARMAVLVDGQVVDNFMLTQAEYSVKAVKQQEKSCVRVDVIKKSESPMSIAGIPAFITDEDAQITPVADKKHKIEFIGDSITCGYGVDDEDPLHPFTTATEDTTRAYAYKTAMLLDADYSMFSASGYGIISGYTPDPEIRVDSQILPEYYESLGFSRDRTPGGVDPTDLAWDFALWQPEVVVINLGTNDDSFCQDTEEKQQWYVRDYVTFLKKVRKNNPKATIIGVLGLMGARLYPRVCEAFKVYTEETGDTNVFTIELPEQDGNIGYVSDYHPLESAHEKAAKVAAEGIRNRMQW